MVTWKYFLAGSDRGKPHHSRVRCTFPELENLSQTSFISFAQNTTKNVPLVLSAKSAYFSVSFALLRWEVEGALSRAIASDEVKGEGGQEGEGHGSVKTFTVSDIAEQLLISLI